ncbi:ATP-dependent endonuclease [Corynebacterium sp. J010B-136]|uniref:ATP-dependent nuclease n=1 Tax=Corynebacterium sp. J010B-136 TaxID=2099401 RepID=UPI000CF9B998|nr:AAA family ATPase [Corynebacterium sp. J010B-136]PQM75254.1 ATP-dependent endonuclease [Corynebacterium sp. J010B-136]
MKIDSIYIDGYRRFHSQTIRLEELSTVLAGANNSGKTSLIDLLRIVIGGEGRFRADDLSTEARMEWSREIIEAALAGEDAYFSFLEDEDTAPKLPSIEVRFVVRYDPSNDDIREFASYLMDLDSDKSAFYFRYRFHQRPEKYVAVYQELYPALKKAIDDNNWTDLPSVQFKSLGFRKLQSLIDHATTECADTDVFFADAEFSNLIQIDSPQKFAQLFNFRSIKAARTLDDTKDDKTKSLNRRLIDVAQEDEKWATEFAEFPDLIIEAIDSTEIRKITAEEAIKSLNDVVESISKTNGTAQSDLLVDFDLTEEQAVQLISQSMQTRYVGEGIPLGEASQGLGYSNLIFLHLEAESFIRSARTPENQLLVNLLVIEEPESHMHPQMQNAFINHLFAQVRNAGGLQGVVTTHSNEIVRSSAIEQLRVLKIEGGRCRVVDLREFHELEVKGKTTETQRLFNLLYSINFSDILFADKVIMYEGDTERMYIQALIKEHEDLSGLRTQYISYVQVGGAYAHIYKPLIVDTLHLKTAIITDIDYTKDAKPKSLEDLVALETSNATLIDFFGEPKNEDPRKKVAPTVKQLVDLISKKEGVATTKGDYSAAVAFQSEADGYGRTLEEAILATITSSFRWEEKNSEEWNELREKLGLKISIPKDASSSIREVVASTANNKTDFMYSLLISPDFKDKVPPYILSVLKWLNS